MARTPMADNRHPASDDGLTIPAPPHPWREPRVDVLPLAIALPLIVLASFALWAVLVQLPAMLRILAAWGAA